MAYLGTCLVLVWQLVWYLSGICPGTCLGTCLVLVWYLSGYLSGYFRTVDSCPSPSPFPPRQQCENMQETLATTQEKAKAMGHRLHSMEADQRRKNGEEEKDGEKKATAKEEKMEAKEAKEEKEEKAEGGLKLDACKHEIDLLRETKRRLLQRLQLDVTFTFPDLLIENAVKTTMDEMKDANDTIARAARDQLWDARRKIGVSERVNDEYLSSVITQPAS